MEQPYEVNCEEWLLTLKQRIQYDLKESSRHKMKRTDHRQAYEL